MKEYIRKSKEKFSENSSLGRFVAYKKDPLPAEFDLDRVLSFIKKTIPEHF